MKKGSTIVAVAVAVVVAVGAVGAGASGTVPAKKRCHFVKKKVHGKIKRVRVCTKPKPKPKPKDVSLSLDRARRVEASIGSSGGSASASSASGARITLAVPAGALSEETKVTLTPVNALRGIGKVRLLAGVELGPDGTALAKTATLTFELPKSAKGAFGIAWFGAGHNVHRYPLGRSAATATIRLSHFSGAGVATGNTDLLPQLETALTVAYAREVRPLMRRAEVDDSLFTPAVEAAFRWLRATELVGLEARFKTWRAEAVASLKKIFANALDKASAGCTNHDLTQLERLAKLDRKAQSLGLDLVGLTGAERIDRCARFELDMDFDWVASLDIESGDGSQVIRDSLHVTATRVPLGIGGELGVIEGSGPLTPTAWHELFSLTTKDFSCSIETNGGASPKDPLRVILELDASQAAPELYLLVDPGDLITPRSPGCGNPNPPPPAVYEGAWSVLYGPQKRPDGRFRIHMTDFVGQEIYATFGPDTHSGIAGPAGWSGTLSFVLRHMPAP